MMVLNTGIAPKREVSHKQFFPNKTSPGHFPDFWSIAWHLPDNCQIRRHFNVFQTKWHLDTH